MATATMKIAIPSNDGVMVETHFGHCRQFVLIDVVDGSESSRKSIDPPAHAPGVFPAFLAEQGAQFFARLQHGQVRHCRVYVQHLAKVSRVYVNDHHGNVVELEQKQKVGLLLIK